MVTRSSIGLLSLSILFGSLHAEELKLQRPSSERIALQMRQEKRSIALRKTVRYGIYTVGSVTLAGYLLRDQIAKVLPEQPVALTAKESSLGYLEMLNNGVKSGAGYFKRLLTPDTSDKQAQKIVTEILGNQGEFQEFLSFIKHKRNNGSWSGTIRNELVNAGKFSLIVAILSWIEQRPLTLLRIYLDRLWSLWHSNLRKTLMQLRDTASNLEIMRTFVEALGQVHLNERDRKFYCSQLCNSHSGFVRSIERLCAMMSVDVHDQDTLDWLGDFNNGFWETFAHFTSLLQEDLQPSLTGEEVVISQGTRNELEEVRVALQQFVATYRAKNI